MNCEEALRRLSERELGDLDAEPSRELDVHLASCPTCAGERILVARVVTALRTTPPAAPSTERRLLAVAAMSRVAEPARPRRIVPYAAAAGFLLALAAGLLLREPARAFRVLEVGGRADRLERREGGWKPLAAGDEILAGDRLVTHAEGAVLLEGPAGRIRLAASSSVDVVGRGRVTLDRGSLRAERGPSSSGTLRVTDTANNYVELAGGAVEAGLREVAALVAGSSERREGAVVIPPARAQKVSRLAVRVLEGEADLGGSHDQRLRARAGQSGTFDFSGQPSAFETEKR